MTDLTREQVAALLDGTTPGPWRADGDPQNRIVWSPGGNRVCFMAHSSGLNDARDIAVSNLVAAAPDIARQLLAAMDRLADADMAQAALVAKIRHDLQFMVDSIAEDKAYVAEKYPALFAAIQARRAEMGTLGGVQVFGEIARDLLCLSPDAGVKDLAALRAEAEAHKDHALRLLPLANRTIAAEADNSRLAAELAEARAQVEALERERDAACKVADGYKADFHAALVDDDGRPCNTDVFLDVAIRTFSDKWDLYEAVKDWVEGDWDGALVGIDRAALAAAEETKP